ncbi:hypothetical protein SDC9_46124 [bioreactor metagenome]|uniref:Uncharacterized protein n=1 Tax=bioreactor metagenome TaxID=1076179 RepID=A0A644WBY7_9ZZZZ
MQQLFDRLLRVAVEHPRVLLVEQRVLDAGIARALAALRDENLLRLPHFQHRHAGDRRVRVFLRRRVHDVVRADHDRHVGFREVVVDLVHLHDDVVGHLRLGQKHVHVPGQTARDRVDREADVLALAAQDRGQLRHRHLRLRHGHAIARNDDHAVGVAQRIGHALRVDRHLLAGHFHRRARRAAEAAEDHRDERAVHRLAHDVGQDCARGADEGAGHDQQIVAEREADRRRGPARIAVQHRHHDRHVGAADAHDQVIADEEGQKRHHDQRPGPGAVHEGDEHGERQQRGARVQQVAARQLLRLAVDLAGKLAEGDDRAGEGDSPDEDAEEQLDAQDVQLDRRLVRDKRGKAGERLARGRVHGPDARHLEIGVIADEHGGKTDEAVQRRDELRHLGHLDRLRHIPAEHRATREHQRNHPAMAHARAEDRGDDGERHAGDAVPHRAFRALLPREATEREDEENGCSDIGSLNDTDGKHLSPSPRSRFLEHGEHPPGDEEAADDVDRGDQHRQRGEDDDEPAARADLQQRAEDDDARDRVRHRHQRRMQRMRHVPDHLEADEAAQREDHEVRHERGRRDRAHEQQQRRAHGQQHHLLPRRLAEGRLLGCLAFLGGRLLGLLLRLVRGDRLDLRRRRREGHRALEGHGGAADHVVFHVVDDDAILAGREIGDHVADVGRIKLRGLRRHPRREVVVADDRDAVLRDDLLARHGQVTVAATFRRKVDDDRAALHRRDHVGEPQLRRIAARDQRRGDDDVHVGGKLAELLQLCFAELGARGRGIATCRGAVLGLFLEIEIDEFGAHRFDLLGHFGTHVEGIGDRAKRGGRADRGQTRDAGADDQHLGRRHLARRRHLTGEEAAEVVRGLHHGAIARDVRHRAERVHLLRPRDPRHHVHRDEVRAGFLRQFKAIGVLAGVEERDHRLPLAQPAVFLVGDQRAHLDDEIDLGEELRHGRDHGDPGLAIGLIREAGGVARPGLDETGMPQFLQLQRGIGGHRDARFPLERLSRSADLHVFLSHDCPRTNFSRGTQTWQNLLSTAQ